MSLPELPAAYTPAKIQEMLVEVRAWIADTDDAVVTEVREYIDRWEQACGFLEQVPYHAPSPKVQETLLPWRRKPLNFCLACLIIYGKKDIHLSVPSRIYKAVYGKGLGQPYIKHAARVVGVTLVQVETTGTGNRSHLEAPDHEDRMIALMEYACQNSPVSVTHALQEACGVNRTSRKYSYLMKMMARRLRKEGWTRRADDLGSRWFPPLKPEPVEEPPQDPQRSWTDSRATQVWVVVGGTSQPFGGWDKVTLLNVQTGQRFQAVLEK